MVWIMWLDWSLEEWNIGEKGENIGNHPFLTMFWKSLFLSVFKTPDCVFKG